MNILLIDHHPTTQKAIKKIFNDYKIQTATDADSAINIANETAPDLVILELSLSGHSGFEFLYEFRTYSDWINIPVIIYSMVNLDRDITDSQSWKDLNIAGYIYKPESSLEKLAESVNNVFSTVK